MYKTTFGSLLKFVVGIWVFALPVSGIAQAPTATATATVADTVDGGGGGATFYIVTAIDGVEVRQTALRESLSDSRGQGSNLVVRQVERAVPAGKVTLKLKAVQAQAAPIASIFRTIFSGGNLEAEGIVNVELVANKRYRVKGLLDSLKREVWIEDEKGAEVAGSRASTSADPEALKAMEGAVFVATNLRYDGDWISDASMAHLPFVPIGSKLKVVELGTNRASILVDGRKMRMGLDWSRGHETMQQFVARLTAAEDPRAKLASLPDKLRSAITAGRIFAGMGREHVLLALGRPRFDFTPVLDAQEWRYQSIDGEEIFLVFDETGLLKEIDGSRKARKLIVHTVQ
jgi:hypothetical protein